MRVRVVLTPSVPALHLTLTQPLVNSRLTWRFWLRLDVCSGGRRLLCCVHVRVFVCVHVCMCACVYVCTWCVCACACMCACVCGCVDVYVHVWMCGCVRVHVYVYVYGYVCAYPEGSALAAGL